MSTVPVTARGVQVVWFKRDLRLNDHAPLHEAARLESKRVYLKHGSRRRPRTGARARHTT